MGRMPTYFLTLQTIKIMFKVLKCWTVKMEELYKMLYKYLMICEFELSIECRKYAETMKVCIKRPSTIFMVLNHYAMRLINKLVTPTNDICSKYVKLNVFVTYIQLIKSFLHQQRFSHQLLNCIHLSSKSVHVTRNKNRWKRI